MGKEMSKSRFWISWVMSGIVILFMLMDSVGKFIQPEPVVEGTLELGFMHHHIIVLGILGFISIIVYAIPRTSVLGALLLTAYFGGAIATHVRLDNPLFSHVLFPVYLALLAWGSLWLRNETLRTLIPVVRR